MTVLVRWQILSDLLRKLRAFEPLQWTPMPARVLPSDYRGYFDPEFGSIWTVTITGLPVLLVHSCTAKEKLYDYGYTLGIMDAGRTWTWFSGWRVRRLGTRVTKAHRRAAKLAERKEEEEQVKKAARTEASALRRLRDFFHDRTA